MISIGDHGGKYAPEVEQLIAAANGLLAPGGENSYERARRKVELVAALINMGRLHKEPYVSATVGTYREEFAK